MHANFREIKIWKMIILELMKCIKCFIHWEESGENIWSFEACIDLSSLHTWCPAFQYWCCCSVTQPCPALCDSMDCSMPGLPVHHQLPEFTQTHVHWVDDAIQPSLPLLSPSPPVFNLAQHQGLSRDSVLCIRWPKYWSFSFSISPSNEYSELISFRMNWLDLLAVQGTLKSLLQHTIQKHQFFYTQLSLWSNSHIHTWLLEKPEFWLDGHCVLYQNFQDSHGACS